MEIQLSPHPLLELGVLVVEFPEPLGDLKSPAWLLELLREGSDAPVVRSEECRKEARNLLRLGGYKPTGRGKPASEYLVRAASEGSLGSINLAVDVNNVTSLHSGLPISVVDTSLAVAPFRADLAGADTSYVFNATGQEIRLDGLLCLIDAHGPCANAVKDSQRTKTHAGTREVLVVLWGTRALPGHTQTVTDWCAELFTRADAEVREKRVLEPTREA